MSSCPSCHYFNSSVNETRRLRNGWMRRHRRCHQPECGHRWYTVEVPRDYIDTEEQDMREAIRGAAE